MPEMFSLSFEFISDNFFLDSASIFLILPLKNIEIANMNGSVIKLNKLSFRSIDNINNMIPASINMSLNSVIITSEYISLTASMSLVNLVVSLPIAFLSKKLKDLDMIWS